MQKTFGFGSIDYLNRGRKNCRVTVNVELKTKLPQEIYVYDKELKKQIPTGKFTKRKIILSICGNIWEPGSRDILSGGQNLDEIAKYIDTPLFKKIYEFWEKYHLKDLHLDTTEHDLEQIKEIISGKSSLQSA